MVCSKHSIDPIRGHCIIFHSVDNVYILLYMYIFFTCVFRLYDFHILLRIQHKLLFMKRECHNGHIVNNIYLLYHDISPNKIGSVQPPESYYNNQIRYFLVQTGYSGPHHIYCWYRLGIVGLIIYIYPRRPKAHSD